MSSRLSLAFSFPLEVELFVDSLASVECERERIRIVGEGNVAEDRLLGLGVFAKIASMSGLSGRAIFLGLAVPLNLDVSVDLEGRS